MYKFIIINKSIILLILIIIFVILLINKNYNKEHFQINMWKGPSVQEFIKNIKVLSIDNNNITFEISFKIPKRFQSTLKSWFDEDGPQILQIDFKYKKKWGNIKLKYEDIYKVNKIKMTVPKSNTNFSHLTFYMNKWATSRWADWLNTTQAKTDIKNKLNDAIDLYNTYTKSLENIKKFENCEVLTCGEDHKTNYGSTGYNNKSHWCNSLISEPSNDTFNCIEKFRVPIRKNKYGHTECLVKKNTKECLWGKCAGTNIKCNDIIIENINIIKSNNDNYNIKFQLKLQSDLIGKLIKTIKMYESINSSKIKMLTLTGIISNISIESENDYSSIRNIIFDISIDISIGNIENITKTSDIKLNCIFENTENTKDRITVLHIKNSNLLFRNLQEDLKIKLQNLFGVNFEISS